MLHVYASVAEIELFTKFRIRLFDDYEIQSHSVGVDKLKVLPWVIDGAGGLGAGKTSGAGTRGVDLNAAIGGRTGDSDTNGGESSNNGSKIHVECYPAENPSL